MTVVVPPHQLPKLSYSRNELPTTKKQVNFTRKVFQLMLYIVTVFIETTTNDPQKDGRHYHVPKVQKPLTSFTSIHKYTYKAQTGKTQKE